MPQYTYQCDTDSTHVIHRDCSITEMLAFEDKPQSCSYCTGTLVRQLRTRRHVTFRAGFYEHVSRDGAYIETMEQLERTAKDNGLYSHYAENHGSLFHLKRGRWI